MARETLQVDVDTDKLKFIAPPGSTGNGVSIQRDLQVTDPSRPLQSAFPRATLGDSGTRILHGIITEEYNPLLSGIQGIEKYDEMRKSDGTVQAGLRACKLPIRRAEWFVREAGDSDAQKEQAEFIRHALFDWIEDMTFDDILRQALLMLDFGVMLFEKVYGTYKDPVTGKTFVTLKKLSPRLPRSILMWELEDHTFGIQQIRQDGVLAQIPGVKLLIFVNDREGDNWWGTSILRSAYQHWYHKQNYYAIDGMGFERQALGVPYAEMPTNYTEADEEKAERVLANLRANERQFLVYPNTIKIGFMDMGARTTRDPSVAIEHHNKEILQSMLAQFLELGASKSSNSGSRALSQDHSDLFLKSMEAVANIFQSVMNRALIRELIDLNYNNVEAYPVLDYNGIAKQDVASIGTAYGQLVTAQAIHPTDADEQYLRTLMGLPPRTQEDIDAEADDEPDEESLENPGPDEGPSPDEDDVEDAATDANTEDNKTKGKKGKGAAKKKPAAKKSTSQPQRPETPPKPLKHSHTHSHPHEGIRLKRTFNIAGHFQSWRPLTAAETKVDWGKMKDMMDKLESDFQGPAKALLQGVKDEYMKKAHALLESGTIAGLPALSLKFEKEYRDILETAMRQAHAYGRQTATRELGHGTSMGATQDDLTFITVLAAAIAEKTAADLNSQASISLAQAIKSGKSPLQAAGDLDKDLDDAIDKNLTNTSNILVGQGINNGRSSVFQRGSDNIYAFQRSEILDDKTCNFCLSMDGRVVAPDDDWADTDLFHSNCRGIWVAILKDEENPPAIEGIPDNVGDYYGGSVNELIQPRAPITQPGSLADQYVQRAKLAAK